MRIVGGKYKGKKISAPCSQDTRPTSDRARETLFNVLLHNPALGPVTLHNKAVLDVFAGTGALGLEAFSRGAERVAFIENNPKALEALQKTLPLFGLSLSSLIPANACDLGKAPQGFDLVFLDPPYNQGLITPALFQLSEKGWFGKEALIVLETCKTEPLSLPPFLSLALERKEGAANLLFCKRIF